MERNQREKKEEKSINHSSILFNECFVNGLIDFFSSPSGTNNWFKNLLINWWRSKAISLPFHLFLCFWWRSAGQQNKDEMNGLAARKCFRLVCRSVNFFPLRSRSPFHQTSLIPFSSLLSFQEINFTLFVWCLVCLCWLVFLSAEPLAVPPPITAAGSKDSNTKPNSLFRSFISSSNQIN